MALADRGCARRDLDSGWLEVTLAGSLGGILTQPRNLGPDGCAGRCERHFLSRGRGHRRSAFWLRNGSARPKEIVFRHGRRLSGGDRAHCVFLELRQLRLFPRPDRCRHRRRIRRDQFGDRRIDPGPSPGSGRFDDQWLILDRRRDGFRRPRLSCSIRDTCRSGSAGVSLLGSAQRSGSS